VRLCASPRSVGKLVKLWGEDLIVEPTGPKSFQGVDIAFISVSAEISRELAPYGLDAGTVIIDDSSAFRMESHVPLVVPEINAEDLMSHQGIISIPNCSTTQMVMALYPLHVVNPIQRVVVDTYQAVSGTGVSAMNELSIQSQSILNGGNNLPEVYPHQIGFNVFPQVETFLPNGYTKEEWKMLEETRKIMHSPEIRVSATCVRVPVYVGHSEALHVEFARPMAPEDARLLLDAFPGVTVLDEPEGNSYPTPRSISGCDDVFVGRIRKDVSHDSALAFWIAGDNLRKGAALNAYQIAAELIARDLLQ
jgi:aspartate-semialdehyde dehydrogenase